MNSNNEVLNFLTLVKITEPKDIKAEVVSSVEIQNLTRTGVTMALFNLNKIPEAIFVGGVEWDRR